MLSSEEKEIKYLYRYRPINEYTIKSLIHNELYFASPVSLNDPFDSKVNVFYEPKKEEDWLRWIENHYKEPQEKKYYTQQLRDVGINKFGKDFNKYIIDNRRSAVAHLGIVSLTSNEKHILMWSHYADSHKGLCFGFETCIGKELHLHFKEPLRYYPAYPVEYQLELPSQVNMFSEDRENLVKFLKTKHLDWQYENEYRLIIPTEKYQGMRNMKFEKHILKKVIFGLDISSDNKKMIKEIVNKFYIEMGFPVKFYQAIEMKDSYGLTYEEE